MVVGFRGCISRPSTGLPLLGQTEPWSISVGEQTASLPVPCKAPQHSCWALLTSALAKHSGDERRLWCSCYTSSLFVTKKPPRWLLTAVAIEWDIYLCMWNPKTTCSLFKQTYEKWAHFPHPWHLSNVLSAIGITSSAWPHLTSGGVGACLGAVLLKNSTPRSTISFQQQIFITGMHLGVSHPRGLPVCFRPQKH